MTTVLGALQNAHINIGTIARMSQHPIAAVAEQQLGNAIEALENGMKLTDVLQDHMFGEIKTGKADE